MKIITNILDLNKHIKDYKYKVIKKIKAQPTKVAIELNRQIIKKKNINKILLKNKDRLAVVHFIGGG